MRNNPVFKILGLLITAALVVGGIYLFNNWQFNKRYAWINLNKVYNEFGMKKDLETQLKNVEAERRRILDSLELHLNLVAARLEREKVVDNKVMESFQAGKEEYMTKKQKFEEESERLRDEYNRQVLTQINQYVKEYAHAGHISMVLGADGTGAVMYAEESTDITDKILVYINNKYKGLK